MTELKGQLEAYWEQGWEGSIAFTFYDVNNHQLIFLQNGQTLTIYNRYDTILWSGKLQFVKRGFFEKHSLEANIWSETKQKGVSYGDWMAWFWQKPPLKAKLILE
ncbi:hypothetical protein Lepto7376_1565 [[Leptolyngbya] sp. PCC 7376]|uniref:hypothetical protein n=1 Tax=[Leptolyngbya] sp. PCC 7376 TaxID=111781 RepID=UPI00029F2C0B|nr:hypothetical protein [[Leptolyngbya] sp. PCC 7376]AFY37905.1 hypothetical protein Lepto7376_1565 [[Leptolyngbya] sp. PCC 7376]